jgi:hypothetical protein
MPPKKGTKGKKKLPRSSEEEIVTRTDVQYNPDIVNGLLLDLKVQVDAKCNLLKNDADFMATSIKQAFQIELIKLPTQVKKMSLSRFRAEFGESLEAVTRLAIEGSINAKKCNNVSTISKSSRSQQPKVFATPSHSRSVVAATPSRQPTESECIYSANGSPLGEFSTVVKAPRPHGMSVVPATPGVFVPLNSGDIVTLEEVENLPESMKNDALEKMQAMMQNMQQMMAKLAKP